MTVTFTVVDPTSMPINFAIDNLFLVKIHSLAEIQKTLAVAPVFCQNIQ